MLSPGVPPPTLLPALKLPGNGPPRVVVLPSSSVCSEQLRSLATSSNSCLDDSAPVSPTSVQP